MMLIRQFVHNFSSLTRLILSGTDNTKNDGPLKIE